ncbi:hypothetical protein ABK040_007852 [Willaertia magna]
MSQKRKTEKNQETIRKLSLIGDNKECMDCTLRSNPYVVLDFGIYVCTFCSGIHRNFGFKAKGISMTNFRDEDVEFMEKHGNRVAQSVWRAKWDPNQNPKPKNTDEKGIKDFIQKTYVKKMWYDESGKTNVNTYEEVPVEPIQNIIEEPEKIEVINRSTPPLKNDPFLSFEPVTTTTTNKQPQVTTTRHHHQPPKATTTSDLDNFFGGGSTTTTGGHQGFGNDDDNWGFDNHQQTNVQQQQNQPPKSGMSLADELFAGVNFGNTTNTVPTWGNNQPPMHTGNVGWGGNVHQPNPWGNQQPNPWGSNNMGGNIQPNPWGNQPPMHSNPNPWGNQPNPWGNQQPPMNTGMGGNMGGNVHQPNPWGNQPPTNTMGGGFGNQPPMMRNLQSTPPPTRDPFSNLTGGFGATNTSNTTSNVNKQNDNPFDF